MLPLGRERRLAVSVACRRRSTLTALGSPASLTVLGVSVNPRLHMVIGVKTSEPVVSSRNLTREAICAAALRIIDIRGLDAVGMRALASELGVKAGSLYHHFESKDALLAGVADMLFRGLGPLPAEREWADQVRAIFLQLAGVVRTHPHAAPLMARYLITSPVARERASALTEALERSELDAAGRTCLMVNLGALLIGHSHLHGGDGQPARRSDSEETQAYVSSAAAERGRGSIEAHMSAGVEALIRGFGDSADGDGAPHGGDPR